MPEERKKYLGKEEFPVNFFTVRNVPEDASKSLSSCRIEVREYVQLGFAQDGNEPPELVNEVFAEEDDSLS